MIKWESQHKQKICFYRRYLVTDRISTVNPLKIKVEMVNQPCIGKTQIQWRDISVQLFLMEGSMSLLIYYCWHFSQTILKIKDRVVHSSNLLWWDRIVVHFSIWIFSCRGGSRCSIHFSVPFSDGGFKLTGSPLMSLSVAPFVFERSSVEAVLVSVSSFLDLTLTA